MVKNTAGCVNVAYIVYKGYMNSLKTDINRYDSAKILINYR